MDMNYLVTSRAFDSVFSRKLCSTSVMTKASRNTHISDTREISLNDRVVHDAGLLNHNSSLKYGDVSIWAPFLV